MKDKLVFEKKKKAKGAKCRGCSLGNISFGAECHIGEEESSICGYEYIYELVEEPQEIESEYEHKKNRYEAILGEGLCFIKERDELRLWLDANKPTKWEKATKDNAKVGDEVRGQRTRKKLEVLYISRMSNKVLLLTEENNEVLDFLSNYEINIYGKEAE